VLCESELDAEDDSEAEDEDDSEDVANGLMADRDKVGDEDRGKVARFSDASDCIRLRSTSVLWRLTGRWL